MTKSKEVLASFQFGPESNRIVGFGAQALLAVPTPPDQATSIGIAVNLLDPETKEPNGQTLILQLQPLDAWATAQAIRAHSKEQGWPFPDDDPVKIPMGPADKKH